ncbi:P-loop containing nucleoside triphosphate hydrolase protein, partial [Mycena leptocephala]
VPASPHIFYGRESELEEVIHALMQQPARIAILGTGGIGKTALALATLHHPTVEKKYGQCHFVSCESANSAVELISIVGTHLGLEPSRQLSRAIVQHFLDNGPAILVLDNMETPWESLSTRAKVEEFLSLLTDVPHLALLITMRGAEHPGKVKWTRPFLPPLEPISARASRQTFVDIADEPMTSEEPALAQLIELTGNLPLAITLMANVASFEGYLGALSRWETENTALLSDGYDKRSNLEKSISMSLTSPRIKSNPQALDLLSLLSLLPDGISEAELLASQVPLPEIPQCRFSLVQTSLAFMIDGRLKALSPIREYMQSVHPASTAFTRPLRTHFQELLNVWESYYGLSPKDLVRQLTSHLGNIQNLF